MSFGSIWFMRKLLPEKDFNERKETIARKKNRVTTSSKRTNLGF